MAYIQAAAAGLSARQVALVPDKLRSRLALRVTVPRAAVVAVVALAQRLTEALAVQVVATEALVVAVAQATRLADSSVALAAQVPQVLS